MFKAWDFKIRDSEIPKAAYFNFNSLIKGLKLPKFFESEFRFRRKKERRKVFWFELHVKIWKIIYISIFTVNRLSLSLDSFSKRLFHWHEKFHWHEVRVKTCMAYVYCIWIYLLIIEKQNCLNISFTTSNVILSFKIFI